MVSVSSFAKALVEKGTDLSPGATFVLSGLTIRARVVHCHFSDASDGPLLLAFGICCGCSDYHGCYHVAGGGVEGL